MNWKESIAMITTTRNVWKYLFRFPFLLGPGRWKKRRPRRDERNVSYFHSAAPSPHSKTFFPSSPLSTRLAKCWFIFIQSQIRKRKVLPSWWGRCGSDVTFDEFSCVESCLDMTVTSCWQFMNLSVCWHHWSPYPGLSLSLQLGVFNVPTSELFIHSLIIHILNW